MKNNVYVRSNKSIKSITLTKLLFLLPLIVYGFYKNGIYLYQEHYISFIEIFRPLIYVFIGALVGISVNILYGKFIKKSKDDWSSIIFSSFHLEYGVIIGCLVSINTNVLIYTLVLFIIFIISKFLNNRINIMCFTLIIIYLLSKIVGNPSFLNSYEMSKTFSYEFMDYLIGRYPGGVASTHVILILLGLFGLYITNNIKIGISLSSLVTLFLLFGVYSLITNNSFTNLFFANNIVMLMSYVATDTKTSCYTKKGMIVFGVLIGILTFINHFIEPVLAPLVSILFVSLFNNLIDRKVNSLQKQ